jgi:hypothetical protein
MQEGQEGGAEVLRGLSINAGNALDIRSEMKWKIRVSSISSTIK